MKNTIAFTINKDGNNTIKKINEIVDITMSISVRFNTEATLTISDKEIRLTFTDGLIEPFISKLSYDGFCDIAERLKEYYKSAEPINFDTMNKEQLRGFAKGIGLKIAGAMSEEKIRELLKSKY